MNSLRHTPFPRGPYATGCADLMHGRTKEGVLMRLFYPCQATEYREKPELWSKWYPGDAYTEGLATFALPKMPSLFTTLFNWQTRACMVPSIWEAPIAEGKFPVIVFSHGLGGHRTIYSSICTDIVSHGFIVAAVEHRDESASASFTLSPSGDKEWLFFKTLTLDATALPFRKNQVQIRSKECMNALDLLERLNKETVKNDLPSSFDISDLRNKLDLSSPVMMGHSMGAATTLLTLSLDKRFKYGVGFDPWMFPLKDDLDQLHSSISQPFLTIMTEKFVSEKNLKALKKITKENFLSIIMKGTAHQNQSDTPFILGMLSHLSVLGATMDRHTALSLNNKITIAFLCKCIGLPNRTSKIGSTFARENLILDYAPTEVLLDALEKLIGVQIVHDDDDDDHPKKDGADAQRSSKL